MVDDVIDPRETRIKLIQALEMLRNKKKAGLIKSMEISRYNEFLICCAKILELYLLSKLKFGGLYIND